VNVPGSDMKPESRGAEGRREIGLSGAAIGEVAARAAAAGLDLALSSGDPYLAAQIEPGELLGRNISAFRLLLGLAAQPDRPEPAPLTQVVPYRIEPKTLTVLDQREFPGKVSEVTLTDAASAAAAIRDGVVQGAGTVAVVGGYGLVLGALGRAGSETAVPIADQLAALEADGWLIAAAAPWVTPLGGFIDRLLQRGRAWAAAETLRAEAGDAADALDTPGDGFGLAGALAVAAEEAILQDLVGLTRLVPAGVELLRAHGASLGRGRRLRVLVHGPVGSLAFGLLGTAVAALQGAAAVGLPVHVWVAEGRPPYTGARTSWELANAGIGNGLVPDTAIGGLMVAHDIDLVLLGALGVMKDGALIDEPGAYGTAALAARYSVPVYVFAPNSTLFEPSDSRLTASYDLTTPEVISGFVTEAGIVRPPFAPQLAALAPTRSGASRSTAAPDREGPGPATAIAATDGPADAPSSAAAPGPDGPATDDPAGGDTSEPEVQP
jgi:methylthioribose-1-phosphate isomerase